MECFIKGFATAQDAIAQAQEFVHGGHDPDSSAFAFGFEALAEGVDSGVPTHSADGSHVQPCPHLGKPAAGETAVAAGPRFPRLRVDSTEGDPCLGAGTACLGRQLTDQQHRCFHPYPWHRRQQGDLLPPLRTRYNMSFQELGHFGSFLFQGATAVRSRLSSISGSAHGERRAVSKRLRAERASCSSQARCRRKAFTRSCFRSGGGVAPGVWLSPYAAKSWASPRSVLARFPCTVAKAAVCAGLTMVNGTPLALKCSTSRW